ncbi:MAG: hypothetical protein BAA02_05685 [Paenibacillaceae bacterium ZCTH02-B3]|nr:MAG: hypothetical protein BAA02_05685 [Paenibacillaceae bacterium ZCTH02-B3]
MAGIGFELKRLYRKEGVLAQLRAHAYAISVAVGPMLLAMAQILALLALMTVNGASLMERELFLATAIYAFIFSLLLTGGLTMVLSRFLADRLFHRDYVHLSSSWHGAAALGLAAAFVAAWLFLWRAETTLWHKAAAYLLFAELTVLWVQNVHLTVLKAYRRIALHQLAGALTSLAAAWPLFVLAPETGAAGAIAAMDAGMFVVLLFTARYCGKAFPPADSSRYGAFLAYFRRTPSLFWTGMFLYGGAFVHLFVYWSGPEAREIAGAFRVSPFFDLPSFYAFLTVVPTLVTFVVSVETHFYEKFRDYYRNVLGGGTPRDIAKAKEDMQRALVREIRFAMEVQLMFTVLALALGVKLLPLTGFTARQLDLFITLALGYYLYIIAFVLVMILLYFDDRRGALTIAAGFAAANAGLTLWSMDGALDGLGLIISAFLALMAALVRLIHLLRHLDYRTYCSQPVGPGPQRKGRRKGGPASGMFMVLAACALLTAGCSSQSGPSAQATEPPPGIMTAGLKEDKRLYERDDDQSVRTLYVTVLPDRRGGPDPLTWYKLNRVRDRMEEGALDIILQEGEPGGGGPKPGMFGFAATEANGRIELRGGSSRYEPQRNYRIKLNRQAGLWNDQRVINLNKHIFDPVRIRNKLSFDLFEQMPDIASLRTQFVHLFVRDLSEGAKVAPFEDYGLYTQVEQPNRMFLRNHLLDPNGYLYKAADFEFLRYPDELKDENDPDYDRALFETRLEIRGREEHGRLLAMLEDVNNPSIPIAEVIERHFDLDNYLTWMAANLLMDNMDTTAQNFLLYSPLNQTKWYFLPWDYDAAWEWPRAYEYSAPYEGGLSNYWGSVLHNRFFRSTEHVRLLQEKMEELYASAINETAVAERVAAYRRTVEPFLRREPDVYYLPVEADRLEEAFELLMGVPSRAMERFKADLEVPKPFFLGDPEPLGEGTYQFFWDPSYDLQGDDLVYEWSLARDPQFTDSVRRVQGIRETSLIVDGLSPGVYFWKVVVTDAAGHSQIPFDRFQDADGRLHYGVREFFAHE